MVKKYFFFLHRIQIVSSYHKNQYFFYASSSVATLWLIKVDYLHLITGFVFILYICN